MQPHCSSDRRCNSIQCEACAWRYSLNISRRIFAVHPRGLFTVTFAPTFAAGTNFGSWRIQVRNLVDYRRHECRWWRDVGLWGWFGSDRLVRGIVSLGSVLEDEFLRAFERRWPTTLRVMEPERLRNEIYFVMRPGIIFDTRSHHYRYQQVRMCIEPSGKVRSMEALTEERRSSSPEDDAMAVVL